jgi:hypothetical protein
MGVFLPMKEGTQTLNLPYSFDWIRSVLEKWPEIESDGSFLCREMRWNNKKGQENSQ